MRLKKSVASVNITVQRMAIPVIIRCVFSRKKAIIVFHHYDVTEKLSLFYHVNAWLLFRLIQAGFSRVKIIVVANYWMDFLLQKGIAEEDIFFLPNLFENERYYGIKKMVKQKQVYLGQYCSKQHPDIFKLAEKLTNAGYYCYFTTLNENDVKQTQFYDIMCLTFDKYCEQITASIYTICFSFFKEGWNRTAHESVLLGTPVIGNDSGGLAELLEEAGQVMVSTADEAYDYIISQNYPVVNSRFFNKYHVSRISYYAEPIIRFCND